MKTIQKPDAKKISIALIPIYVMIAYVIITRSNPVWVYVVGGTSIICYFALLGFFCIKQKCYQQLWVNLAVAAIFLLTFFVKW